ncbi:hypothetical protein [Saccharothrix longispora]|uniref:alpha/beta hydrolase family protein n=1 Tax=Saccharothrix longispora TaxID=33920 RepID=UPI0028FD8E17|nr:hypothetical protein [Saccharothrix longispora]MBY8850610.1 hypothetical protein [Saccharothrix sp. MB29]MDU0287803.1 hypothetical protein [Saccharothrix longispora]
MPTNTSSLIQVPRPRRVASADAARLPARTGPHPVGTTDLRLVDRSRSAGVPRELGVTVHYPARPGRGPLARPVVLFSPAAGRSRAQGAPLTEDLAGRGYVVISVEHRDEPFAGGRVPFAGHGAPAALLAARVADLRFTLDRLADLTDRFPLDPTRVGVFGHAAGGVAAARTAAVDPRVTAGAGLDDGNACARSARSIAATCPNRPFLLVSAGTCDGDADLSWRVPGAHDQLRHVHVGVDPVRAVAARRTYLAAFFDRHLAG